MERKKGDRGVYSPSLSLNEKRRLALLIRSRILHFHINRCLSDLLPWPVFDPSPPSLFFLRYGPVAPSHEFTILHHPFLLLPLNPVPHSLLTHFTVIYIRPSSFSSYFGSCCRPFYSSLFSFSSSFSVLTHHFLSLYDCIHLRVGKVLNLHFTRFFPSGEYWDAREWNPLFLSSPDLKHEFFPLQCSPSSQISFSPFRLICSWSSPSSTCLSSFLFVFLSPYDATQLILSSSFAQILHVLWPNTI